MGTRLMDATEVAEQLGTSKAYAYKVSASSMRNLRRKAA